MAPQQRIILLFSVALAGQSLIMLAAYIVQLGPDGRFGGDFVLFWEAARRLAAGQELYAAAEWQARVASGMVDQYSWFVYPPFAALGLLPLADLSYTTAVLWWSVLPVGLYALLLERLGKVCGLPLRPRWGLIGLSTPFLLANLLSGQTGAIIACLLLGAALQWERRPLLAGVLIGLCAIKPQLGLLFPFVLAAGGQWRTFAAAAVTVLFLCLAATLALGAAVWGEYLAITRLFASVAATQQETYDQLALGPYVSLRVLEVPVVAAAILQAAISGWVLLTLLRRFACKAPSPVDDRLGLLAAGALLATPYALLYDTPLLMLALLPLLCSCWNKGLDLLPGAAALALLLAPSLAPLFADRALPFAFIALLALFAILAHRSAPGRAEGGSRYDLGSDRVRQLG